MKRAAGEEDNVTRVSDGRALWIAQQILPYEAPLRRYLDRWKLPHDLDVDDVVQETYGRIAAMESVERIKNPRAYMFSIARSIVLMHIRRARVVAIGALDENDALRLATDQPSPEVQVSDREQLHLLAVAVAELPEPGRRAFMMRMIDELPHREIGDRLGMSENAVQKSVAKSLIRLMARLCRDGNATLSASKENRALARTENGGTRDERRD